MNNTPNSPAELLARQPQPQQLDLEQLTELVLKQKAADAGVVAVAVLEALRDFHADVANRAVEQGESNWFVWTRDAERLNTALQLLLSVELN